MATAIYIALMVAFIFGAIVRGFFIKDKEIDTDRCVKYLKEKGYWVNLNIGEKK